MATEVVRTVAELEGVSLDPELLLALVATESSGNPDAESRAGAVGLVQVRAEAFHDMATRHPELFPHLDRHDPSENLLAGALYLVWCAQYLDANVATEEGRRLALNAYNAGPAAMRERHAEGPLPSETRLHAQRVLMAFALANAATPD